MSHKLEIFGDGSASFISQGTRGWHLLGTLKEQGYLTVEEMIEGARLHQPIFRRPLTVQVGMGEDHEVVSGVVIDETTVDGQMANCRMHPDTGELQVLGIGGKDQALFQPRESFAFGQNLLDSKDAIGVTAGTLRDGKLIFASFLMPTHIMIGGVDPVNMFLGIIDSYDGTRKFTACATPIRFECFNTVTLGVQQAVRVWTLKHTKNAALDTEREDQARQALTLTNKYADEFVKVAEELLSRKLTKIKFENIITKAFGPGPEPTKRMAEQWEVKRNSLLREFADDNLANVGLTAWAGYNAVVRWLDWEMPVRGVGTDQVSQNRARFARSFEAATKLPNQGGKRDVDNIKLAFQKTLLAATK